MDWFEDTLMIEGETFEFKRKLLSVFKSGLLETVAV